MIELVEYRPSDVSLDEADLEHLLALVKGTGDADEAKIIVAITPTRKAGTYQVTPGPFVGRLGLPSGATLDVRSRFEFGDVIELIRRSGRAPIRLDRLRPATDTGSFLIDVVALALAREVKRLVAFGLAKGYQTRRFDRPPHPGRPDVTAHIGRYAARPDKLVTLARRLTHDIEVNQAVAAALDVVSRVPLDPGIRRAVAKLIPAFGRVKRRSVSGRDVANIELDRLTSRYAEALLLAEIILRSQDLLPIGTGQIGASILFNMPRVWEAFVAQWAREQWGPAHDVRAPHGFRLTSDGSLHSEADVTVWSGKELVALYDAKYKLPGDKPSMGDVYQMVTYCSRLGIDQATLVYPTVKAENSYRIGSVTVKTMGLDVGSLLASEEVVDVVA